jgi:tetratricopeptide (TPR) repeat protein
MMFCAAVCVSAAVADDGPQKPNPSSSPAGAASDADSTQSRSTDEIINDLIEELGSESYATRIRARNQLQRYGLEAFDALRDALDHSDSEIVSAARYLISSMDVNWAKESDPKAVREILFEYGAQRETERLARIEMLGRMPGRTATAALARLARFDPSLPLSRRAAMLVLQQPIDEDNDRRLVFAERILDIVGSNERDACRWLAAYADDLRKGQFQTEQWQAVVLEQRRQVDLRASSAIHADSVMELIRVLATRAIEEDSRDAALAIVQEHIDLVTPQTRELSEHADWSVKHGLFPVVRSLYERNLHLFHDNAELLYSAAQAFDELENESKASELADQAIAIKSFPGQSIGATEPASEGDRDGEEKDEDSQQEISDTRVQELGYAHYQVAQTLRLRGRFGWAERELKLVAEHCDLEMPIGAFARFNLARMFSEQLRHQDAVDAVSPLVERLKKDRDYKSEMNSRLSRLNEIHSLFEYESALARLKKGPRTAEVLAEVKEQMQTAYRYDSRNIDILIRMYRLEDPNDPAWKPRVVEQIVKYQEKLRQYIGRLDARRKVSQRDELDAELAEQLNQFAWLVANTEGDYDRALKSSLRSLELTPNDDSSGLAARLDTCARCYFAVGELEKAVQTQKKAIALDPYSPPMLRQLEQFQAALADNQPAS